MRWAGLNSTTAPSSRRLRADFEALITTDKNLRYQRNLAGRRLAILVLPTTSWPTIQAHEAEVVAAVNALRPGDVVELNFS
jgi:hypothetical protein